VVVTESKWQPARLFPITGIGGADEQERRGCSALMAVIQAVREFGRELTSRCGAPAGTIETYIEVPFENGKFRPDGLIRVTRGKTEWTALVEVKTGRVDLPADQVENYVDIARNQGFDAVITISHQVATTPGVHPVAVDKRKLHRVALFHLSWSRIHTEALIQQSAHTVSDPDQAWILSEFIRYLEEKKSGALDFEDMGPHWTKVRDACPLGTLRAADPETLDVVSRFDQLVAFLWNGTFKATWRARTSRFVAKGTIRSRLAIAGSERIRGEEWTTTRFSPRPQRCCAGDCHGRPQGSAGALFTDAWGTP
jgi:hypothetical protein